MLWLKCYTFLGRGHALRGLKVWTNESSSLLRQMESDSAVLTLVGSSFHHWGAKTEELCLSRGLCSVPVPLTALKASTIVLNWMRDATGSQWRSRRKEGVTWEDLGKLLMRHQSQEGVAVVQVGDDQRLDQDLCCIFCEERPDPADLLQGKSAGSGHCSDRGRRTVRRRGWHLGSSPLTKVIPWHTRHWLTGPYKGSLSPGWRGVQVY